MVFSQHSIPLWQNRGVIDDSFELYDLRIDWVAGGQCFCQARSGDHFYLYGEQLHFPAGQTWSIYTLAALLPLLPAKQRPTHPHDWMTTDGLVACPDPNCTSRFRITRCGVRKFRHSEVTAVPLPEAPDAD